MMLREENNAFVRSRDETLAHILSPVPIDNRFPECHDFVSAGMIYPVSASGRQSWNTFGPLAASIADSCFRKQYSYMSSSSSIPSRSHGFILHAAFLNNIINAKVIFFVRLLRLHA